MLITLIIRQKGKSQNGCYKKTKPTKFSGKLKMVCFDLPFFLITDDPCSLLLFGIEQEAQTDLTSNKVIINKQ